MCITQTYFRISLYSSPHPKIEQEFNIFKEKKLSTLSSNFPIIPSSKITTLQKLLRFFATYSFSVKTLYAKLQLQFMYYYIFTFQF